MSQFKSFENEQQRKSQMKSLREQLVERVRLRFALPTLNGLSQYVSAPFCFHSRFPLVLDLFDSMPQWHDDLPSFVSFSVSLEVGIPFRYGRFGPNLGGHFLIYNSISFPYSDLCSRSTSYWMLLVALAALPFVIRNPIISDFTILPALLWFFLPYPVVNIRIQE